MGIGIDELTIIKGCGVCRVKHYWRICKLCDHSTAAEGGPHWNMTNWEVHWSHRHEFEWNVLITANDVADCFPINSV